MSGQTRTFGGDPCGGPPCICLTASSDALEAISLARELNAAGRERDEARAEVAHLRQENERLDSILARYLICAECGCGPDDEDTKPDCLCTSDDCGCPIIAREKAAK